MQDTLDDSDDEVDYSKMDQGNKKGPVGRWDFDTQEEYSTYMSNKEALLLSELTGCPTQVSDFTSSTVITFGTSSKL
jgi:hypothetical protein